MPVTAFYALSFCSGAVFWFGWGILGVRPVSILDPLQQSEGQGCQRQTERQGQERCERSDWQRSQRRLLEGEPFAFSCQGNESEAGEVSRILSEIIGLTQALEGLVSYSLGGRNPVADLKQQLKVAPDCGGMPSIEVCFLYASRLVLVFG